MVEIQHMSSIQLEHLIEVYPWFTAARREYIVRLTDGSKDASVIRGALRHHGLFFLSRGDMIKILSGKAGYVAKEKPAATVQPEVLPTPETAREEKTKTQYYIVGGDYFGQADFDELEKQGLAVETPTFNPIAATLGDLNLAPEGTSGRTAASKADEGIYTETLAEIYFQQQIYKRAIEIYEKLILLYPEKSTYFASLIEKVKNIK